MAQLADTVVKQRVSV